MKKRVLIVLTEGFEDIEAVAPVDVLNRAGIEVTIASAVAGPVRAAYGTTILADTSFDAVTDHVFDGIVLPGGVENARSLAADSRIVKMVRRHFREGRLVAAICAAPSHVLGEAADILKDREATGDLGFNDRLAASGARVVEQHVVVDRNLITGMGPGAALKFALAVAAYLVGQDEADKWTGKWRLDP